MPPPPREPARRPTRARGTGSITADRNGFRAAITLRMGGEQRTYRQRFGTYEDAEEWLNALVEQSLGSRALPRVQTEIPTLDAWMRTWVETHWESWAHKTRTGYNTSARIWIIPVLGNIRLDNLDRRDYQRFTRHLATGTGIRRFNPSDPDSDRKPISYDSQMTHWRCLRAAMNAAVSAGVISAHRLRSEDSPRRPATQVSRRGRDRAMSDEDLRSVMRTLESDQWQCTPENHVLGRCRAMWLLRLTLAVRQGEALAARWERTILTGREPHMVLDSHAQSRPWLHGCQWEGEPEVGLARLNADGVETYACGFKMGRDCARYETAVSDGGVAVRTRVYTRSDGGMFEIPGLKSREPDSSRTLALSSTPVDALTAHRSASGNTRYVFGLGAGMSTPERDTRAWKMLLSDSSVATHYRIHDVRHTSLTIIAAHTSLRDAQEIAGHAQASTTALYLHSSPARTRAGIDAASDYLATIRDPR